MGEVLLDDAAFAQRNMKTVACIVFHNEPLTGAEVDDFKLLAAEYHQPNLLHFREVTNESHHISGVLATNEPITLERAQDELVWAHLIVQMETDYYVDDEVDDEVDDYPSIIVSLETLLTTKGRLSYE